MATHEEKKKNGTQRNAMQCGMDDEERKSCTVVVVGATADTTGQSWSDPRIRFLPPRGDPSSGDSERLVWPSKLDYSKAVLLLVTLLITALQRDLRVNNLLTKNTEDVAVGSND